MNSAPGSMRGPWLAIAAAAALTAPALALRVTGFSDEPVVETALFGIAILGAAFLLGAGGELAEVEISRSLALALIALVAILPEYAVDLVFAWKAADDPQFAQYAAANMTGSNRLLIGVGWALVVLIFWYRQSRKPLILDKRQTLELTFLLLATAWAFTIFLRAYFQDGSLNIVDTAVLFGLFAVYIVLSARSKPGGEEHAAGPMAALTRLSRGRRRTVIAGLFIVPALVIIAVAEPFASSLIETGKALGIDEFFLVQWVAPLASEAPEIGIAAYFAFRGMGPMAMGVLVSAKVNQWTLLVGSLPLVYMINLGSVEGLPLDDRQLDEFLLTAAQSLFAILMIVTLRISWRGALALFVLFVSQLFFTDSTIRITFAMIYLGLSLTILTVNRERRHAMWALMGGWLSHVSISGQRGR
ncbi:MAG: sodium:calcium antiporter [Chloroflexi bacterium]|nr:sodium:calcium antiporter [Chloroflexota bacterium]